MNGQVFWLTYASLWIIVLALAILVVLLYRQVGLVYLGSRRSVEHGGVPIGKRPPAIEVHGWEEPKMSLGAGREKPALLIFTLPGCSICDDVSTGLASVHREWQDSVEFIWVEREGLEAIPNRFGPHPGFAVVSTGEDGYAKWDIRGAPFAYLIGRDGTVVERRLVNSAGAIGRMLKTQFGTPTAVRTKVTTLDASDAARNVS
jgi:hypothetical protein